MAKLALILVVSTQNAVPLEMHFSRLVTIIRVLMTITTTVKTISSPESDHYK